MKITEALQAEHHVFHNVFDHLEKAVPRAKSVISVRALAALLDSLLDAHTRVEDQLLMEPLEHCIDHMGQYETFHQEHEAIGNTLKRVQTARNVKEARRLLFKAVLLAREHFDKEERLVFPMAEERLNVRTLSLLGGKWQEQRKIPVEK